MTLQQAAQTALDCQDACNLSGVLASFKEIVHTVLWPEARRLGKGTNWVNEHPIVALFTDKLVDLNRYGRRDTVWSGNGNAHDAVKAIAAGEPEVCAWCGADEPHVCKERV